jgi:transcriptional regulator with XRE-family HTH domain
MKKTYEEFIEEVNQTVADKEINQMNFGLNLKLARTAAGMTQMELAGRLGIAQKQLSRYERGEQAPSVEMAVKIADVLGVDMNTLTKREIIKMKDQKPEFRYLVENAGETIIITDEFDNLEDANKHARYLWNHLTKDEKKTDTVQVLYVEKTEDYFEREILDSEDFEWSAWTNADSPEGGFDSSELEE